MRILITGAGGQVGRALQVALAPYDVVPLARGTLDVTDGIAVAETLAREVPDWVVHCAALTDTARCEREPALARSVNEGGTWSVAAACARIEAKLVLLSTNEVFDGAATHPYAEDAATNPINLYGRTKREAERLALAESPETRVVRTSWVYGDGAANFVAKVLALARDGRPLRFVSDEIAAPTSAADLAAALRTLIERDAPPGVYHLANEGEASRYAWAQAVLGHAGVGGMTVESVTTAALRASGYSGPPKPPYSVLANVRARTLGVTLRPWGDALAAHFARAGSAADG